MLKILVMLPQSQRHRISHRMNTTSNIFEALRCPIILLLDDKHPVNDVSQLVGCVRATMNRKTIKHPTLREFDLLLEGFDE